MVASMRAAIHLLAWIFLLWRGANATVNTQDLGGDMWSAVGNSPPSSVLISIEKATVPGCIHTDWYNSMEPKKENNPYYRFNDVGWRNIAENNWSYRRTFSADSDILTRKEQWLVCEGLDTVANVSLNGKLLGTAKNMFLRHVFNISGLLQNQYNQIIVSFESAVRYVNSTRQGLEYSIPPECPPDVQHGFCHVNLIRKEQCSFSWDWGPGFATQGIWKPIYILAVDEVVMMDAVTSFDWASNTLYIETRFHTSGTEMYYRGTLHLFISELAINNSYKVQVNASSPYATFTQKVSSKSLKLWWPNGQGEQKLYNITILFESEKSKDTTTKTIMFGFRRVELVQEPVNGSNGLSFYFKINDRPIFAKGSNWIPADAFSNRLTKDNYTNLLQSAKDANMNMLRVWGGGIYESDEFYEIANRMGIMIWHDFMFACAMYPANEAFLHSVSKEVNDTVWRLKSHASIVIWAGNNENEAALGTDWYNTTANFERYKKDYVSLYVDTIGNLVSSVDNSRPFLTSSPTNGAETKKEGWVAKNPYDVHYGDVHYYNYNDDCLDWTKYPKTRFASEYGFQSWPSVETLEAVSIPADLSWTSNFSKHRNHHADGNDQILKQISMHFNLPTSSVERVKFEGQVYLSQIMQGLCYKSETEFYRRSRSEIVKGQGHTMGALYWQLNDIWQAPTWSSIEYGGKWKAVHYFAKQFFSNVALSAYDEDTQLTVYSLSDVSAPIEPVTLVIEMRPWNGFNVIHTWTQAIYITPQSSKMQYQASTGTLLHYGGCDRKESCYFVIYLKEMPDVSPTFFYPVPFKNINGLQPANIEVTNVRSKVETSVKGGVSEFTITLSTSDPSFFVWMEATGIKGRFSENAFMFYTPNKTISFYAWEPTSAEKLKSALKIKSLADVYKKTGSSGPKYKYPRMLHVEAGGDGVDHRDIDAAVTNDKYWLDGIGAQLAFGICGVLFIMFFAILLVCVVMRFNSPHLNKPRLVVGPKGNKGSASRSPFVSDQDELIDNHNDDDSGAFLLNLKNGYGHTAKNVEIKFYVT